MRSPLKQEPLPRKGKKPRGFSPGEMSPSTSTMRKGGSELRGR